MQQQRVDYKDILAMGFTETIDESDTVYFDQHGFHYSIVSLKLVKKVRLDWDKATGFVKLTTMGKDHSIMSEIPVYDIKATKAVINAHSKNLKKKRFNPGKDVVYWRDEYRKCMASPHHFFTEYFRDENDQPLDMGKEEFDTIFQPEKQA